MEIVPEAGWRKLAQEFAGQTVLLVGATDVGKTTLTRYLSEEIPGEGYPVALVDADIGQSSLGLPGTVALGVFRNGADAESFAFDHLTYVGTTNAARVVSLLAERTAAMVRLARGIARTVLVDTTGLVRGPAGNALKTRKIRLVGPDSVVAVEREGELEALIESIDGAQVMRLPASARATTRTSAARARRRQRRLRNYFQGARSVRLETTTLAFTVFGRLIPLQETGLRPGSVVGLGQPEEALGLVEGILADSLIVRTPFERVQDIRRVATGDLLLDGHRGKSVI